MVAVFCKTQSEFDSLELIPKMSFIRITSTANLRIYHFTKIILMQDWYLGGQKIVEAYNELEKKQPLLFESRDRALQSSFDS